MGTGPIISPDGSRHQSRLDHLDSYSIFGFRYMPEYFAARHIDVRVYSHLEGFEYPQRERYRSRIFALIPTRIRRLFIYSPIGACLLWVLLRVSDNWNPYVDFFLLFIPAITLSIIAVVQVFRVGHIWVRARRAETILGYLCGQSVELYRRKEAEFDEAVYDGRWEDDDGNLHLPEGYWHLPAAWETWEDISKVLYALRSFNLALHAQEMAKACHIADRRMSPATLKQNMKAHDSFIAEIKRASATKL